MKGEYISIRYFDNLVSMLLGQRPEACNMTGVCQCNCVIEADRGVYSCDFYVLDKLQLGNIREAEIKDMLNSDAAKDFIAPSLKISPECRE